MGGDSLDLYSSGSAPLICSIAYCNFFTSSFDSLPDQRTVRELRGRTMPHIPLSHSGGTVASPEDALTKLLFVPRIIWLCAQARTTTRNENQNPAGAILAASDCAARNNYALLALGRATSAATTELKNSKTNPRTPTHAHTRTYARNETTAQIFPFEMRSAHQLTSLFVRANTRRCW